MIIMLIVFAITILLLVIGLINKEYSFCETFAFVWFSIFAGVSSVLVIIALAANTFPNVKRTHLEEKRNAIVYEMEHGFYVGDSLGEFNADLKHNKMLHQNPWTSWFIGGYVMDVEPIETDGNDVYK